MNDIFCGKRFFNQFTASLTGNPPCPLHHSHVLEFTCLEEDCRDAPLMCYICKDYGKHQGHKHSLLEFEAERVRSSVQGAIKHVKTFYNEISDYTQRIMKVVNDIEGMIIHNLFSATFLPCFSVT